MNKAAVLFLTASALALSACSGGAGATAPAGPAGPAAPAEPAAPTSSWGQTVVIQRPSLDPARQPATVTENFSEFDPSGEFVMTDVGDVTCTGYGTDQFGKATGPVTPENGRFYAVQVALKVYEDKWMDQGSESLNANNFSYISPSGAELKGDRIATVAAQSCLSSGTLSMYTYEGHSDSGMLVFDIPSETGGKLVSKRYAGEKMAEEEFPLDR